VSYLDADGRERTSKLLEMPYLLKVIAPGENTLELEQMEKILDIINDRKDLAFLLKENPLRNTEKHRIMGYQSVDDSELRQIGDVLLVDAFNRVIQIYEAEDPGLYGRLLEDISFSFPMVDFRLEKLSADAKSE